MKTVSTENCLEYSLQDSMLMLAHSSRDVGNLCVRYWCSLQQTPHSDISVSSFGQRISGNIFPFLHFTHSFRFEIFVYSCLLTFWGPYWASIELHSTAVFPVPGPMSSSNRHHITCTAFYLGFPSIPTI